MDENGAAQLGQRRSNTPPHCAQASGMSASNSSNQRLAAPHVRQNATQSPRTFRRSSRSQSLALPMLAIVLLAAGCGASAYDSTRGATIEHRGTTIVVVPHRHGNWRLVLLHGRGAGPKQFLTQPLFDELAALGTKAPVVVLPDGGDHSYWHNRRGGRWGSQVLRLLHGRVALGGISMGGFGSLLLGPRSHVCALGAHSPALWQHAGDTAAGAFDDAADFARNGIVNRPPDYGKTPLWIDVGSSDPFRATDVLYAHEIHAQLHVWPGGHDGAYWRAHVRSYLRFYAAHCS
jgi:hypothetical protein